MLYTRYVRLCYTPVRAFAIFGVLNKPIHSFIHTSNCIRFIAYLIDTNVEAHIITDRLSVIVIAYQAIYIYIY